MASKIQAGSINLMNTLSSSAGRGAGSITHVRFPDPFPNGANVMVMPMALACDGLQCIEIHIDEVTSSGFKMRVKDSTDNRGNSNFTATVGWLAYTADSSTEH